MCQSNESCFKIAFNRFISTRVSEDLAEQFVGNKEYINLSSKIENCIDELNSLIPEEHSELLEKYMSTSDLRELLVNELLYLQGLKDGIQLRCLILMERACNLAV